MAWPPPVLPINQTNATPQQDTHPQDHARTNLAVNDAVDKLKAMLAATGTPVVSATSGAGTVTNVNSSPTKVTVPSAGVWLFAVAVDLQQGAPGTNPGGYGFVDFYPSTDYAGNTNTSSILMQARMFETDPRLAANVRSHLSGLYLQRIPSAGVDVFLRAVTFGAPTGQLKYNSAFISAVKLALDS